MHYKKIDGSLDLKLHEIINVFFKSPYENTFYSLSKKETYILRKLLQMTKKIEA